MNDHKNGCCSFHPTEIVVGVCPFCLNERLVIIAAKQQQQGRKGSSRRRHQLDSYNSNSSLPAFTKSKIFALGSLLHRLEIRHRGGRSRGGGSCEADFEDANEDLSTSSSLEDSFISIKFEDNGIASWEKKDVDHRYGSSNYNKTNKSLVVQQTPQEHGMQTLRWQNRVGQLLQRVSWRRSHNHKNSSSSSSSSKSKSIAAAVDGVGKNRKSWIRTALTRTRTRTRTRRRCKAEAEDSEEEYCN